jgi:hypothetical protein
MVLAVQVELFHERRQRLTPARRNRLAWRRQLQAFREFLSITLANAKENLFPCSKVFQLLG